MLHQFHCMTLPVLQRALIAGIEDSLALLSAFLGEERLNVVIATNHQPHVLFLMSWVHGYRSYVCLSPCSRGSDGDSMCPPYIALGILGEH